VANFGVFAILAETSSLPNRKARHNSARDKPI
jgi:hypothetical protein